MIEFAFVGPIFFLFIFGIFDIGYAAYNHAILEGAVQAAGRDAGIEGATNASIDAKVAAAVKNVNKFAVVTFERKNYAKFSDVNRAEDFIDANGNGSYDSTECFTDENGNGSWNADVGSGGQGGADDVVVYTATAKYDSIFPLWSMLNWQRGDTYFKKQKAFSATTTLRNQPYSQQGSRTKTQICP
ncbi:MAG: pilus assembly protein [Sphingomonadales bacterium]|nr:pilus assembly protein [Sphingomonadales bacterium]